MKYRVRLQPPAQHDLDESYSWAAKHAPQTAARWLARFEKALQSLADNPQRCGLAPEHKMIGRELCQLLFGRKPSVFRAVFIIDGETVRILRIRRAARRLLTRKELGDA